MKLTFVSNYFNHHQKPLCEAFVRSDGVDFCFIATEPMEEERIRMGWGIDAEKYPYVKEYFSDIPWADNRIQESDVVIWGGVESEDANESLLKRLEGGKLTFRYSERIYKEGQWKFISPRGQKKKRAEHTRFKDYPYYLLCAGAYVGSDYNLVGAYPGKKFVWGYFPEFRHYDPDELFAKKSRPGEPVRILWAGRMIDWKHPEIPIIIADKLLHGDKHFNPNLTSNIAQNGGFKLTMAGGGYMEEELRKMVSEKGLEETVEFTGFLTPEQIREKMEESDIFLFTSDRKEGWGAVLNEAMNSGCLVVANYQIGAAPYLLQQNLNGKISGGVLWHHAGIVGGAILDRSVRTELGKNAYETIEKYWNADNAARRFLENAKSLLDTGKAVYSEREEVTGALQPMCKDPEISPRQGERFTRRY